MTPEHFPTVILHDAAGLFHVSDLSEAGHNPMMQTLAIGLNLYMVSQNCSVSSGKHPLLHRRRSQAEVLSSATTTTTSASGGFKPFRGVIFANGTVLEEAPPGFCRTCTNSSAIYVPARSYPAPRDNQRFCPSVDCAAAR